MPTIAESGYLPSVWEFIVMAGVPGLVLLAGYIVQRRVAGPGMPLPLPVALILFIGMVAAFFAMQFVLATAEPLQTRTAIESHANTPMDFVKPHAIPTTPLPLWFFSGLFYLFPMAFYINLLRNSYATGIVDRIGPLSARIEDPSAFSSARKLALRGDVDGAVQMYRNYKENTCDALFEAARLLKAEDRFAEAAAVFQEIADKFYERRPAWAEATYQIAKINEQNLMNITYALELYRSILSRTPESRFAALAAHDVARLQVDDEDYAEDLVAVPTASAEKDPFFGKSRGPRAASEAAVASGNGDTAAEDAAEPIVDPFFQASLRQRSASRTTSGDGAAKPARKAASKAAPAKTAAAAKKPVAKKATAAKKPAAKPARKKKASE